MVLDEPRVEIGHCLANRGPLFITLGDLQQPVGSQCKKARRLDSVLAEELGTIPPYLARDLAGFVLAAQHHLDLPQCQLARFRAAVGQAQDVKCAVPYPDAVLVVVARADDGMGPPLPPGRLGVDPQCHPGSIEGGSALV